MPSETANRRPQFPSSGRVAAVDFGSVRIGIAICDPDWILASPLEVIPAANWKEKGKTFHLLVERERIVAFVVGLPIHLDGGESQKSIECRAFARWLGDQTGLPVRLFDERFTTADANRRMADGRFSREKKKKRVDAVAALVLLESFLEACRYRGEIVGEGIDANPSGGQGL